MVVAGSALHGKRGVLMAEAEQKELFKKKEGKWRYEERNKLMG